MADRLTANVVLRDPGTGRPVLLPAGSVVPEWATGRVGDHVLEADPESDGVGLGPDPGPRTPDPTPGLDPPPRTGPGSGRARWWDYAVATGVSVDLEADATREDILAACRAAGVPVD